jgi:hypothetical protein
MRKKSIAAVRGNKHLTPQNIPHQHLTPQKIYRVQIVCLHGNSMKLNVRCDHSFFLELQNIDHKSYITEMLYLVFWTIYQWTKKNWLTILEYLCHKSPQICSTCHKHFPVLSSFMTCHMFVTRLTWRVPLVEQKLLTLLEHLSCHSVTFWGTYIYFCRSTQSFWIPIII